MTSKTLDREQVAGVVLAHGASAGCVRRHLPYWLKVCHRVMIITPLGHSLPRIENIGVSYMQAVENGGAYSPNTNQRATFALETGLSMGCPYTMLYEYDSLTWGEVPLRAIPGPFGMGATVWPNEKKSPVKGLEFAAKHYLHFPHLYTRGALEKVIPVAHELLAAGKHEGGYTDRFLGLAVEKAETPVLDWRAIGLSYSYENISGRPNRIAQCAAEVANGVIFSHGIKDSASLDHISQFAPFKNLAPL
jgi:hypothetical protein